MDIDILTTGEEILAGITVDTNSSWIADRCIKYGHKIVRMLTVGDDEASIAKALNDTRANCVIVTGGLGPTSDDVTISAAANAFGLKLHEDQESKKRIEDFFNKLGKKMTKTNIKQAMVPKDGVVLRNDIGTAPGIRIHHNNREFYFLPGVPHELYPMFISFVEPWLARWGNSDVREDIFTCFGTPEATLGEIIEKLELKDVYVGYRVRFPYVEIKLRGKHSPVDMAGSILKKNLGDIIIGVGSTDLQKEIGTLLKKKGLKLSTAESCTGGLLANLITDIAGSSKWFDRGVVTYSNKSKIDLLEVSSKTLEEKGAVSEQVALEMADGIFKKSNSDITVSITGIAGPSGGSDEKSVGTVCFGFRTNEKKYSKTKHFPMTRLRFKTFAAAYALNMIRTYLLEI